MGEPDPRTPSRRGGRLGVLLVVAGAAWLTARAQPAPPAPATPGPARIGEPIPAGGALLLGDALVVLEADLRGVAAYDVTTGVRRWRTAFQEHPQGAHELAELAPGRVLVLSHESLVVLDLASGRVLARQRGPASAGTDRAFLWIHDGACAVRNRCSFQAIDCADARPIGEPLRGRTRSRMRWDRSGWDSGCWGFDPDVVGRGGAVVVLSGEDGDGSPGVVGLDVASGRQLWRRAGHGRAFGGGASPGGSLCWTVGEDDRLHGFDCQHGRERFSLAGVEHAFWSEGPPAGLFVLQAGRLATYHEPRRGRRLWRRRLGAAEVALVAGARLREGLGALEGDRDRTLSILSARDGTVLRSLALPRGAQVTGGPPGVLRVGGLDLELDATGAARAAPAAPLFEVERGPGNAPATVYVLRPARRAVLRLPGDAWSLGEHTRGDTTWLVLYVADPAGPGVVRVLSAPRP